MLSDSFWIFQAASGAVRSLLTKPDRFRCRMVPPDGDDSGDQSVEQADDRHFRARSRCCQKFVPAMAAVDHDKATVGGI